MVKHRLSILKRCECGKYWLVNYVTKILELSYEEASLIEELLFASDAKNYDELTVKQVDELVRTIRIHHANYGDLEYDSCLQDENR